MKASTRRSLGLCVVALTLVCCTEARNEEIAAVGEGGKCSQTSDCKAGFDCTDSICTQRATTATPATGDVCTLDADCCPADNAACGLTCVGGRCSCSDDNQCTCDGEGCSIGCGQPLCPTAEAAASNECPRLCIENLVALCAASNTDGTDCPKCAFAEQCAPDAGGAVLCDGDQFCRVVTDAANPPPKTANLGEACKKPDDCRRPYVCGLTKICIGLADQTELTCTRSNQELGVFRAYFEVPPHDLGTTLGADEEYEFFRLPFPNSIRFRDGSIDFSGFQTKEGIAVSGTTGVADLYVQAATQDLDGYGPNAPVFFRFSGPIDRATICAVNPTTAPVDDADQYCTAPAEGQPARSTSVHLVNLSDNTRHEVQIQTDASKAAYMCQNWIGVGPRDGQPLEEATTYAVILTTDILGAAGNVPVHDQDFALMFGTEAPSTAELSAAEQLRIANRLTELDAAHAAYAPLRTWLATDGAGITAEQIASAAVFTTGTPGRYAGKFRERIAGLSTPAFNNDAVWCNDETQSADDPPIPSRVVGPCGTGLAAPTDLSTEELVFRNVLTCPPAKDTSNTFHEIHGSYSAPFFQQGARPYTSATSVEDCGEGIPCGAIAYDADSAALPVVQGTETICYALTIPQGTQPSGGWPVIIYSHGTAAPDTSVSAEALAANASGGATSFRSFVNDPDGDGAVESWAKTMAAEGFAMIGIDGIMHNSRQRTGAIAPADFDVNPGQLFFNILNPRAARDNVLQGASDLFYLTRLLAEATISVTIDGTPTTISFDTSSIHFLGHSQGAVVGAPYVPFEARLKSAVFTGAGAELALSILSKSKPVDIPTIAKAFFDDPNIERVHPMMGIVAALLGPADSVTYARSTSVQPVTGFAGTSWLLVIGNNDTFSPDATQEAQRLAGQLPLHADANTDLINNVNSGTLSAGAIRYDRETGGSDSSNDGHFVGTHNTKTTEAIEEFFKAAKSGTPTIKFVTPLAP